MSVNHPKILGTTIIDILSFFILIGVLYLTREATIFIQLLFVFTFYYGGNITDAYTNKDSEFLNYETNS